MEIKNKKKFKLRMKAEIARYIGQFPLYFWMNIAINIVLVCLMILAFGAVFYSLVVLPSELMFYGVMALGALFKIFSLTINGFLKNVRILSAIQLKYDEIEIEDYELDNLMEFIQDLPMKKEEVERLRTALSYGKLIDILDLIGFIVYEEGVYDLDVRLRECILNEEL